MSDNTNNTNKGFYWSNEKWEMTLTKPEGQSIKVPVIFMLFMAPLLGGLLVITLPFMGFFILGKHLMTTGYKSINKFLGSVIIPKIAIGKAYFKGKK